MGGLGYEAGKPLDLKAVGSEKKAAVRIDGVTFGKTRAATFFQFGEMDRSAWLAERLGLPAS